MSNFKKTFQLVAVFLFVSVVQLSAQTYKYQKIVGFSDETNAKLEAFLQSTISMNIRKVAVFDCDGTLFGQVPYYLAEEALYEYARRNYAGKKDAKSVEKFKLVDKMIHEDAISRERDRIKFLSGMTPEEIQRIGDDCFHLPIFATMASRHGLYQPLQSCFISASVLKNSASKRTV